MKRGTLRRSFKDYYSIRRWDGVDAKSKDFRIITVSSANADFG